MQRKHLRALVGTLLVSTMAASLVGCLAKPGSLVGPGKDAESVPSNYYHPANLNVDPKKSLFVTDLSVVEDPVRTTGKGVWTFGTLMTRMANGHDPELFVRNWLKTWETDQNVNGDVVKAKKLGIDHIIDLWPKLPDGKLDLTKAPFRLQAITNRVDLRTPGNAGESRFVFSYIEPNNVALAAGGPPQAGDDRTVMTVIFEYGVDDRMITGDFGTDPKRISPTARMRAVAEWAKRWQDLSSMPYGPAYNAALQKITDVFSGQGTNPTKPNGSPLNQLRTNEIQLGLQGAFGPGGNFNPTDPSTFPVWEMREFHVMPSGGLGNVPVALTPHLNLNNTSQLGDFINENEAAILKDAHQMPTSMLAGSAIVPGAFGDPELFWDAPNIQHKDDARFRFSQNTCSGCHLSETGLDDPKAIGPGGIQTPTPFIAFLQVRPRRLHQEAVLSSFLTGDTVTDKVTGKVRDLNDLQRRVDDIKTVLKFNYANPIPYELEAPFPGRSD